MKDLTSRVLKTCLLGSLGNLCLIGVTLSADRGIARQGARSD